MKKLPLLLFLLSLAGCFRGPYYESPEHLGFTRDADLTVTDTQVTITEGAHTFTFNRDKRTAIIDGTLYYLHTGTGHEAINLQDCAILKEAVMTPAPVKAQLTVLLDAGHGGKDTGCRAEGVVEKTLTLAITREVQRLLRLKGHTVLMTREGDSTLTLDDRTNAAAKQPIDAFISIHINSAANLAAKGSEIYTLPAPGCAGTNANSDVCNDLIGQPFVAPSTRIALAIQRGLVARGCADRGVKHANFKVLRDTAAPAVLIEPGFITNQEDFTRLSTPEGQRELAAAIAEGIEAALSR